MPAAQIDLHKRLIKSAKFFWRDSGLFHTLAGLADERDLYSQPGVGASWEGRVIEQMISRLEVTGSLFRRLISARVIGLRSTFCWNIGRSAGHITISSHPEPDMLVRLGSVAELVGADHAILVSRTNEPVEHGGGLSMDLRRTLEMLLG